MTALAFVDDVTLGLLLPPDLIQVAQIFCHLGYCVFQEVRGNASLGKSWSALFNGRTKLFDLNKNCTQLCCVATKEKQTNQLNNHLLITRVIDPLKRWPSLTFEGLSRPSCMVETGVP